MTVIERLEALAAESKIGKLQHVPGIFKHYVAADGADQYGNPPESSKWVGFSIQEMDSRDGSDVPAEAQAQLIVSVVNALPDLLKLARAVQTAHPQRDPRHRVSMLANDWTAICNAAEPLFREDPA